MVKGVQITSLKEVSKHRDLRFGLNLPQYISYVESFSETKYPRVKLGRIISLEYGKGLTEEERSGSEFPVMGSNGIVGYHDEFLISGPAIIVGRKGSAGAVTYIEQNCYPIDTTFFVKPLSSEFNLKFLSYLLETANLNKLALFKGVPGLNRYDAYELLIPVIPEKVQEAIIKKVAPIEKEINSIKAKVKEPLMVINEVFAKYYGFDRNLWKSFGKGMTAGTQKSDDKTFKYYDVNLNGVAKSSVLRISSRFHNPLTIKLDNHLHSKPFKKLSTILLEEIRRGVQPKPEESGTIWAIKTGQLKNGSIDTSDAEMLTEEFYNSKGRGKVKQNDVLIASTGKVSLGKVDVYEAEEPGLADGHLSIVRIDEEKYNKWFLTYFLRSILGAFQFERDYTGTTNQIEIYSDQIKDFDIPDIDLKAQQQIVEEIRAELDNQSVFLKKIQEKKAEIGKQIKASLKK